MNVKDLSMHKQKGSITAMVLMIMAVMMIIGTTYMVVVNNEMRVAAASRDGIAAQYLAEAGALLALNRLYKEDSFRADTNSLIGIAQSSTGTKNDGMPTAGTFTVKTNNATSDATMRKIVSIAKVGNANRSVVVMVRYKDITQQEGVFSSGDMILHCSTVGNMDDIKVFAILGEISIINAYLIVQNII